MAQAQYDKFIELRKSGVDALTARKQAYGDIPTAPTVTPAPVTPTPTGGATIAPQVQQPTTPTAQPVANRGDVVVGANGEKFIQANNYDGSYGTAGAGTGKVVNQSGQAMNQMEQIQAEAFGRREGANIGQIPNKPMTEQEKNAKLGGFIQDNGINSFQPLPKGPTQLPAGTNEPVKAIGEGDAVLQQAIEDAKNGIYRTPEFYSNLRKGLNKNAEIKAQNEATMAENKQQAELRQAERDKVTQDANNALASNEGAILNTLKTGGIIPDSVKTSPYYKSAQQTYNKLQQFSTYSIGELTTALDNGSILPGTSVYNELLKDPAMKQKLTEAQSYTTGVPSIPQSETVTQEIIANNPTTASYLADGVITQDEWDNATNNAEVVAKAKDVEAKTNKYNQLYAEYEAIEGEVKSQFPGSPFADSIIADRQKAKYKNVLLAKGEMDTANGTLTELKSNAANLFETNLKLYQDQQKQANEYKMADYQAKLGMQKSVFDANLGIKTKQAEFEQGLAQQAEMAKDPTTAIGGILSQFQKLGITSDMDVAGHLASFQASGLTLPEYTKQMIEKFKAKPEYQKAMQLQMGQLSDAQKMSMGYAQDLNKMAIANQYSTTSDIRNFAQQKEIAKLNNDYNRQDFLFQLENDPAKRLAMAELEEKLNANKSLFDVLGKNVGTYEGNRGYDLAGKLGDPMPAGGNWKVKSVIDANYTSSPYGNSVLMEDENGNEVRYSHLQSIGVKPGDQLGFGDVVGTRGNTGNVRGANGETLTAEQLAKGRGAHLDVEIKSGGKLLSQDEQVDYLKSKKAGQVNSPLSTLGQFMKDNQDRGTGYSNDDVKAFNEKIDRLVKAGDTNGMALAYRNMVMKDKDFKKEFDDTTVFVQALDQVQSMINEYEAAGKSTNALKGMAEKVSRKLGITQDEALAKLQTQLGVTMANYIRSISGTAASDVEVQRLMGNMAQIGNVKNLNTAIVEQVRNNGLGGLKKMIDNRMYGMPEDLKPAVFGDIYTQTQNSSTPSSPNYNFQSDWENL